MVDVVVGVDPGSDYLGIAVLYRQVSGAPRVEMHGLRVAGKSLARRCEVIAPVIDPVIGLHPVVGVEQPPPTANKHQKRGHQAPIGWRLGLAAGLVTVPFARAGCDVQEIPVRDWRRGMLASARAYGMVVPAPNRRNLPPVGSTVIDKLVRNEAGELVASWRGCAHFTVMQVPADRKQPSTCPECRRMARQVDDPVRDAWKRIACLWVQRVWPAEYAALVDPAKSRARTEQPDHTLAGVADACEAVGVGMHIMMVGSSSNAASR